jgi:glycosyltransferase involved in cell wall biosynthesis
MTPIPHTATSEPQQTSGSPRVLFVTTVSITLEAFLQPFARHFRGMGWRVDCACREATANPHLTEFDSRFDLDLARSPISLENMRGYRQLRRLLLQNQYDLVHVHSPVAGFVVRLAAYRLRRKIRAKVVYTAHGFHFHRHGSRLNNLVYLQVEKICGFWTDHLIVINKEDLEAARRHRMVPLENVSLFRGVGIDLERYSSGPSGSEVSGLSAIPHPRILMIGEFNRGKRHTDTLRAMNAMTRKDCHLLLAGCGGEEANLRALAASLGLTERVHFLGWRRDIPRLLPACDVLAMPSEREGLPRSVMEAMAAGVPVVGANARGTADLLEGDCGLIHPIGDWEKLARHLDSILADPALAKKLSDSARARIQSYSLGEVVDATEKLYLRLIDSKPVPSSHH